ncbi:MAG: response regulator, partial [Pseudomonadota bacterium]
EDSSEVRQVICRLLRASGCQTHEAEGPAGAISLWENHTFDAVFLDWDLPGLGALDILRVLSRSDRKVETILCVTHNDPREMALARAAGGTRQLMKPYNLESLTEVLESLGQPDDSPIIEQQSA